MPTHAAAPGVAVGVLAVLVVLAGVPAPISAHVNDVGVDAQVSTDGTVVVETAFIGTDGFVVLHESNGSVPGDPVGHAAVSEEGGLKEDVTVDVAPATWRNWSGDRRLWAVLHADDGDGEFEPDEDEMIEQFGDPAGEQFTLARGDAAYVTAREFAPQPSDDGTVRIRSAALPTDGHVVLRADADDGSGESLGSTALTAGTQQNVTVAIDEQFFRDQEGSFTLYAAVYADDGDGAFDDADEPIRAGSEAVATRFGVEKTGELTSTATDDDDHHDGGDGHDHDHSTNGTSSNGSADDPEVSVSDGAGFGSLAALVAAALVAAAWPRRR